MPTLKEFIQSCIAKDWIQKVNVNELIYPALTEKICRIGNCSPCLVRTRLFHFDQFKYKCGLTSTYKIRSCDAFTCDLVSKRVFFLEWKSSGYPSTKDKTNELMEKITHSIDTFEYALDNWVLIEKKHPVLLDGFSYYIVVNIKNKAFNRFSLASKSTKIKNKFTSSGFNGRATSVTTKKGARKVNCKVLPCFELDEAHLDFDFY